jgi:hypothetical protein
LRDSSDLNITLPSSTLLPNLTYITNTHTLTSSMKTFVYPASDAMCISIPQCDCLDKILPMQIDLYSYEDPRVPNPPPSHYLQAVEDFTQRQSATLNTPIAFSPF